jgi:hypothetical protein
MYIPSEALAIAFLAFVSLVVLAWYHYSIVEPAQLRADKRIDKLVADVSAMTVASINMRRQIQAAPTSQPTPRTEPHPGYIDYGGEVATATKDLDNFLKRMDDDPMASIDVWPQVERLVANARERTQAVELHG